MIRINKKRPINKRNTFDYLEDYLYKTCYLDYRNKYYRDWNYVQELNNILSRKNFAYNIGLSYHDIKLIKLKKEEQLWPKLSKMIFLLR